MLGTNIGGMFYHLFNFGFLIFYALAPMFLIMVVLLVRAIPLFNREARINNMSFGSLARYESNLNWGPYES